RARPGPADARSRLPALRPPPARRVHVRRRAPGRPGFADRFGRSRLRRGLGLREPGRGDDRALVPYSRLPALVDRPPRHLDRTRPRGPLTMDGYADRRLDILVRDR